MSLSGTKNGELLTDAPRLAFSRLVLEKVPLLFLSVLSALITVKAQRSGMAVRSLQQFPLGVRIENAIVAYGLYLWKMVWPSRLAPLYPHPGNTLPVWQVSLSALHLGGRHRVRNRFSPQAVFAGGMVLVLGYSTSGPRLGAGGRRCHGGSLRLRPADRNLRNDCFGAWTTGRTRKTWGSVWRVVQRWAC